MRFKLCILPNGKSVLTTEEDMNREQINSVKAAFDTWAKGPPGEMLIAPSTEIVRVLSVDLDIEPEQ